VGEEIKRFIQRCAEKYDPGLKVMIGASTEENKEFGTTFCEEDNECFLGDFCTGDQCSIEITDCDEEEAWGEGTFHTHPSKEAPEKQLDPSPQDLFMDMINNHKFGVIANQAGIKAYMLKELEPAYMQVDKKVREYRLRKSRFEDAVLDFELAEEEGLTPERELDKMKKYIESEEKALREEKQEILNIIQKKKQDLIEPVEWKKE